MTGVQTCALPIYVVGLCLLAAPAWDLTGRLYAIDAPLSTLVDVGALHRVLSAFPQARQVLDAPHADWDGVWRDLRVLYKKRGVPSVAEA